MVSTKDVLLKDGHVAVIRALDQDDDAGLRALNRRVSQRTRVRRYFSPSDSAGDWYVDTLLKQRHPALVAVADGQIVALASFAPVERDPSLGELALLVDDLHQAAGLGSLLLEHLAQLARKDGIRAFVADVLIENSPMLHLLAESGFRTRTVDLAQGVAELSVDLADSSRLRASVHHRDAAATRASLLPVFQPRSVAVVGSARPGSLAGQVAASLASYRGALHLASKPGQLATLENVDLVVLAVPAEGVLAAAQEAVTAGAKGLLVLTADFAESGPDGRSRQRDLVTLCRAASIRLIGPNCLGIVNTDPAFDLNATFCDARPRAGGIALVSQSGAVGVAALRHAERRGAGLSLFVSTGNKADVSGNDLLQYLESDDRTTAIALYLESFGNPLKFVRTAAAVGRTKPVVVLISGNTEAGARAGLSHTAAAATPQVALDALLHEAGVLRAHDLVGLFDLLLVLDTAPLPRGNRIAIIGNSGGPGVLAADACARAGLRVADLAEQTRAALTALAPAAATGNPVDLLATVGLDPFERAVDCVLADPNVDGVVAIYTPLVRDAENAYAAALLRAQQRHPDVPVLAAFPGVPVAPEPTLACFEFPEQAIGVLGALARYVAWRDEPSQPEQVPVTAEVHARAKAVLDRALPEEGDCWLAPQEAAELLSAYGIPVAPVQEAQDVEAAVDAAERLGYPVALKAKGVTVVHKSDVGGVLLDLADAAQVRASYALLTQRLGSALEGVFLQRMYDGHDGLELIAGVTVDDVVGPLVLVGAGGVDTELLDDRVVRLPPRSRVAALDQLSELRCAPRFGGYRGRPPLALNAVADVLLALGALASDLPEVRELDLNPLMVSADGTLALDVRVRAGRAHRSADDGTRSLRSP